MNDQQGGNMADMFGKIMDMQRRVSEAQESIILPNMSAAAWSG